MLQLQDGSDLIERSDVDDIAVQLLGRNPDEDHGRFLHRERDHEAEERGAEAMKALAESLAEVAFQELLRKQAGA